MKRSHQNCKQRNPHEQEFYITVSESFQRVLRHPQQKIVNSCEKETNRTNPAGSYEKISRSLAQHYSRIFRSPHRSRPVFRVAGKLPPFRTVPFGTVRMLLSPIIPAVPDTACYAEKKSQRPKAGEKGNHHDKPIKSGIFPAKFV